MLFLMLQVELVFGLNMIINKDLGVSNIYLSRSLVYVSQCAGFLLGSLIVPKFNRRAIHLVCSGTLCVLSGVLLLVNVISKQYSPYSDRSTLVRVIETRNSHKCWRSES